MIASYLVPVPDIQDWSYETEDRYNALQNLALTSKAWNPTAYEYLHYRVEVAPQWWCDASSGCHTAERVLSRLLKAPEVARWVKELSTHYWPGTKNAKYTINQLLEIVDALHVTQDLESDIKRCIQRWSAELRDSFPLHTILPAICNRLQVYETDLRQAVDEEMLKAIMSDSARHGSTVFQCLREMNITGEQSSMDLDLLDTILRLPVIQTLSTDMLDLSSLHHLTSNHKLDLLTLADSVHSSLRRINLERSIIQPKLLAFLLNACPRLQSISVISETLNEDCEPNEFQHEYEDLGNVLRQFGTRLTSLQMAYRQPKACEVHIAEYIVYYSYSKTLGNLATLTALRTLSVQVRSLFGRYWEHVHLADILPASLERLELADFDENVLRGNDRAMDTESLPTIGPEEFGASESRDMRRHIDRELASIVEDERFGRLSRVTVVCTDNSRKLWPNCGRHNDRVGTPQIVYNRGHVEALRKITE